MRYLIISIIALFFLSCSNKNTSDNQEETYVTEETEQCVEDTTDNYNLLVDQVVDLWMFNNLNDYKSYHKLIPSIELLSSFNDTYVYQYSIKYAATNKMGGTETNVLIFKVILYNPFNEENYTNDNFSYEIENITSDSLLVKNGTLK